MRVLSEVLISSGGGRASSFSAVVEEDDAEQRRHDAAVRSLAERKMELGSVPTETADSGEH